MDKEKARFLTRGVPTMYAMFVVAEMPPADGKYPVPEGLKLGEILFKERFSTRRVAQMKRATGERVLVDAAYVEFVGYGLRDGKVVLEPEAAELHAKAKQAEYDEDAEAEIFEIEGGQE